MRGLPRSLAGAAAAALGVALVGATLALATPVTAAAPAELLGNGGFESGATGWTPDSWGGNDAQLALVPNARTGTTAARVSITSYTDGDGKWIPAPVAVTAGTSYRYVDWYQSDAATQLWARFTAADGTTSWTHLAAEPATAAWAPATVDLTAPDGATAVTVLHVLASTGSLLIDDVSLTADPQCTPSAVNGLPNGDFEDGCRAAFNGVPESWAATPDPAGTVTYGDTSAAASGAHAVTITNTADGNEAGIHADVAAPLAGQRYALAFAHQSTTYVYAYLTFVSLTGVVSTQSLSSAPATGNTWSRYRDAFVTPSDVAAMTVTIATSGAGTVALDDVTLTPLANQTPDAFRTGMVSLTFDDGALGTYASGLPALVANGFHGTFYVNGSSLGTSGFMTPGQLRMLAATGNEIGSHLYTHSNIVQLDDATLRTQLSSNVTALQRILGSNTPIRSFASPYGSYTSHALDLVMQYHQSHRTTDGAMNTKANLDPRTIHAKLVTPTMSVADITALVRKAQSTHSWLVLVYHNIANPGSFLNTGEPGYTVTPSMFTNQLAAIRQTGVAVAPVSSALATLQGQ